MNAFLRKGVFCALMLFSSVIFAQADLSLNMSVNDSVPLNRDYIVYTINLVNAGPTPTTNVVVQALLPRGLRYVSNQTSGDPSTYDGNTGLWTIPFVNVGSEQLKITAQVVYFPAAFDFRNYWLYNAFAFNNGTFTGDAIGGKVAAGHDLSLTGVNVGGLLSWYSTPVNAVVAGHDLNYIGGAVHYGNVVYGNTSNLPSPTVSILNGTLSNGSPVNFAASSAYLSTLSSDIAGYTIINGHDTLNGSTLLLTGTDTYLNVFSVSGSDFNAASVCSLDVPKGSVSLINVSGATIAFGGLFEFGQIPNSTILFNFYGATSVNFTGSSFAGTVLAPGANVTLTGSLLRGQVFANNINSIASYNAKGFIGYVPLDPRRTLTSSISASDSLDPVGAGNSAHQDIIVNYGSPYGNSGTGLWSLSSTAPGGHPVLTLARLNPTTVIAGTANGVVYSVDNNGVIGSQLNSTMPPVAWIWSLAVNDSGHIFAATEQGLYRSNDTGATWFKVIDGVDVRTLTIGYNNYVYAGTWGSGVYRSTNYGYTWAAKNEYISSRVISGLAESYDSSAVGRTLFAATFDAGVSLSFDQANNWRSATLPYDHVVCLARTTWGVVFAGTYGDGVYRSLDNGNTWQKMAGVPDAYVYAIRVDGEHNVFASVWMNGIYASQDLGTTWTNIGTGGFGVSAMFPLRPGVLLAGTNTGKLLVHNSPATGVKDQTLPKEFALEQNYPNPFNPSTTISFALPKASSVSLKIYNALGQEVAALINGEMKEAGSYKVAFNASKLSSGLYIYQLKAGSVTLTKKMSLLK